MKISSRWSFKSITGKVMMGLVLAGMIGSIDVVPAIARDDQGRMERRDGNRRYENKGPGHDRGRYKRRVYRSNDYRERVYAPPPVFVAPPPPPGIGIFLPPVFIRP